MPDEHKRRGRGRPPGSGAKTEVDPALAEAICANLKIGLPLSLAAEAEGVPRSTAYEWHERFPVFAGMIARARAVGARNLAIRALSGEKGSSMAAWTLERRYREDYGNLKEGEKAEVTIRIEGGLPRSGPNETVVVSPDSAAKTE